MNEMTIKNRIEDAVGIQSAPEKLVKQIRSFVDAVKNGGKAPVPSSQIIYNQAILDGIARSAKLGREIELEIPEV